MTTMKKLFALMLAVLMLLSVCALAEEDDYNIDNHTFTAYQIFSGKQGESTDILEAPLTDIGWGAGINDETFLTALKEERTVFMKQGEGETSSNIFSDCVNAQDVADVLSGYDHNSPEAKKFAQIAYAHKSSTGESVENGDKLDAGYYLIVDTTGFDGNVTDNAYNAALLQVTDTIEIQVKTSVPTVEKKVKDVNDSEAGSTTGWQDSADYDVGDVILYQLTATLGNELSYYDTYKVEFVDTLSTGLNFDKITSVKIAGHELEEKQYDANCNDNVLTITIDDVLSLNAKAGDTIVVEYTATLNDQAIIGSKGNPNTVYLEYSNNPNNTSSMGKTKEDKVTVFTYKLEIEKTDSNDNPLAGAAFELQKKNATTGIYEIVGMGAKDATLTEVKVDGSEGTEASTITKYIASWERLDDGEYKLVETKTPDGYNSIKDIEFTISATHDDYAEAPELKSLSDGDTTTGTVEFVGDEESGIISATIINKSGATLPETGGIGTTIFYVAGGVLVLLAVVLLVTKRRVGENN